MIDLCSVIVSVVFTLCSMHSTHNIITFSEWQTDSHIADTH